MIDDFLAGDGPSEEETPVDGTEDATHADADAAE